MKKYYCIIALSFFCQVILAQNSLKNINKNFKDHHKSKYIMGDNAYSIEKGKILYQNVLLGYNNFTYGVSENFSINAGVEAFSALTQSTLILFINPKYTFNNKGLVKFGFGANTLLAVSNNTKEIKARPYVVATVGEPFKNLSVTLGYLFGETKTPTIQLGSVYPINKNFSILIEAFLYKDDDIQNLVTPNIQYHNKKSTFTFGLTTIPELEPKVIPMLSYSKLF